jgi:hypothetical protein
MPSAVLHHGLAANVDLADWYPSRTRARTSCDPAPQEGGRGSKVSDRSRSTEASSWLSVRTHAPTRARLAPGEELNALIAFAPRLGGCRGACTAFPAHARNLNKKEEGALLPLLPRLLPPGCLHGLHRQHIAFGFGSVSDD